jgi:hypothetical protein
MLPRPPVGLSMLRSCSRRCARARASFPGLAALAVLALAGPARAQSPRPWNPPGQDSVQVLASEARLLFRRADVDTIDERNIVPFERVGQVARRLLRRLGRQNMLSAPSIEPTLDSLGFDTDVVHDPDLPSIVFVLVRNPDRLSMQAVGYLLWFRGPDLRMQGIAFPPSVRPKLESWWSGTPNSPYAAAIVYHERGSSGRLGFKYLRLSPDGFFWNLVQYEGNGPELGAHGDASFTDLDGDGRPELVSFSHAPSDSVLMVEAPVQPILREAIYTDRGQGFVVHDARIVPGPLSTLRLFIGSLRHGEREAARRLLVNPDFLELAVAAGWATGRSPRTFVVDRQEEGQPWPQWLGARVAGPTGERRWVFHFVLRDGRWLIREWRAEQPPRPDPGRGESTHKTGGNRP